MKVQVALLSLLASTTAFTPTSTTVPRNLAALQANARDNCEEVVDVSIARRNIIISSTVSAASLFFSGMANASLLDEFGTDPSKIQQEAPVESSGPVVAKPKGESNMEPNLRSNYYYPTNKKRYLPRIKRCNDALSIAAEAIGTEDWETADEFTNKIAEDTILPLKLYTSSLTGGGTNVKVSFTKDMNKAADKFEKAQKALAKAVAKKDRTASSKALEDLSEALQAYRQAGKLTGPDAGGDIPSVDEIRRSACRVQGRTFEQKVKERDARLAAERSKLESSPQ
jgi:hypothetical protein